MMVKPLLLLLLIGVIIEVHLVSPPYRVPCGNSCGCDKTTKCPGKLTCQTGEVLVDRPPFCEPTCCDDCSNSKPFPLNYLIRPTCVCKKGLVRHNGACIEPCQCPSKGEAVTKAPLTTTSTASCNDDVPYKNQPAGCQSNAPAPVKPSCGCPQMVTPNPCLCQSTPLPCPCQAVSTSGCPVQCYPPPPVAPPNPCGPCGRL
ncbi:uncharacterized protein LOC134215552 [Armigeres subalbatus]|uniref:uncharacterized protein LOC134215552 n=1 Tax=Armigeres subalbatus TaxID=124917 RepID=UPI002ED45D59